MRAQVPQFIYDDCVERGEGCNVVCTQPRRISATAVSSRVAEERGEPLGGTVGYQIRFESKADADTRMLFCTVGILLRRLQSDPTLKGVSHILIDEIHERDSLADFVLIIVRDLLMSQRPDLKVVLMSATLDADIFVNYFKVCVRWTADKHTHPLDASRPSPWSWKNRCLPLIAA